MLDRDDIQKVANLARLEFSESELGEFTEQLKKIVSFVEQLNEVETDGIEPMAHPLEIHSVIRADHQCDGLTREAALSNSPNHSDEFFLVPPVMMHKSK